ncbi:MerR family transcriptional regulator [uncultured Corynebacterium sp.]|uniref:MerR family transcriptional regulator n=1 Tax=uncultured Corynebacterium sp. TaxID=159447 RepID=UPI0028E926B7|nr:MerR family transcriptional regulator [uncultured Corynebacterium sp.]
MRVSDAAKIAGCSVRTVRYYHNLGLLPVPTKQRGPWRDYEFADVARLIQIRSMAQAGMRLDDIRLELSAAETAVMTSVPTPAAASTQLVDASTAAPAADIVAPAAAVDPAAPADCDCEIYDQTLRSLDRQIAKLQQQRARLLEMKQQAMMKSPPLSKTVHDLYMEAEEILKSEQEFEALGFIQRKHKLAILFSELGFFKTSFDNRAQQVDPRLMAEISKRLVRLQQDDWTMADVENLVEYAVAMDKSVPPLTGMAYQLTRRFLSSQTAEMLCVAAYPEPGMKAFIRLGFARFRTIYV